MFPRNADNPQAGKAKTGLLLARLAIATVHLPRIAVQAHPSVLADGVARDGCVGMSAYVPDSGLHHRQRIQTQRCKKCCSHPKPPLGRPALPKHQERRRVGKLATLSRAVDAAKAGPNGVLLDPNRMRPSQWAGPRIGRYLWRRVLFLRNLRALFAHRLLSALG